MGGQTVAAQMFLFDKEQVNAGFFGIPPYGLGSFHVGGIDRTVHSKCAENLFGFPDEPVGLMDRQELGKVGLAEFGDKIEFAVGEEPRAADAGEYVAGMAFKAFPAALYRALPFQRGPSFFNKQHAKA